MFQHIVPFSDLRLLDAAGSPMWQPLPNWSLQKHPTRQQNAMQDAKRILHVSLGGQMSSDVAMIAVLQVGVCHVAQSAACLG
jgi:hypothetical protein